jgi:hypothetical protein
LFYISVLKEFPLVRGNFIILVAKLEGKRPFGRPRLRWEDNIKIGVREMGLELVDLIYLSQDRDQ